ncbi:MAG TPA: 3-dehydroquinate synthase [Nitrospiraceae bacterium]|nr:3-dehydroquinate synthase [Nitrospiraceae bacterium]
MMADHFSHQTVSVSFDYSICFTDDVLNPANPSLATAITRREPWRRHRVCPIIDQGVAEACPLLAIEFQRYVESYSDRLESASTPLSVTGGESAKNNPEAVKVVQDHLAGLDFDRQSAVVVIGGGAVLDMAGYAAAVTHRGVRVVRLPTTVLSQDDSGVSVKNGVNAYGRKNYFGTFSPPFAVINDIRFLATLSRRDTIAGLSEAVKAALIRDAGFFAWIADHADGLSNGSVDDVSVLVRRSAALHLKHIAGCGDPFEQGNARPLDFGHWAAHKLETLSRYELRHGEAVAIGVALDTLYSCRAGYLNPASTRVVLTLLRDLGLPLWHEALAQDELLDGLREFREHLGGELKVTLLSEIGQGFETDRIEQGLMLAALDDLRTISRSPYRSTEAPAVKAG